MNKNFPLFGEYLIKKKLVIFLKINYEFLSKTKKFWYEDSLIIFPIFCYF